MQPPSLADVAGVEPRITRYPDGITAVDTEYVRPGLAAAHVIQRGGRAAFVDVGTTHSVPYLLAALRRLGVPAAAVDYVFVTHVHLDHAGGVGRLMQELPNARAVLHPRGAPHLIAPEKLVAGSRAVYGAERYQELYGDIVPVAADRVVVAGDGQRFELEGRALECIHTPGHALHHHCIVDLEHAGIFTGDTFGLSYRELDTDGGPLVLPTTTPTQFDPDQLVASIHRLLAYRPTAMYLMHYGRVTGVERLGVELEARVRQLVDIARANAGARDRQAAIAAGIRAAWNAIARRHGSALPDAALADLLDVDIALNAQGLVTWLDRQAQPTKSPP
jgi:glyoxylase-like metal-dependent hydrolase (beta-lactamase superfamily II)